MYLNLILTFILFPLKQLLKHIPRIRIDGQGDQVEFVGSKFGVVVGG